MKRIFLLVLLVALSHTLVGQNFVSTKGRHIVTADGQPLQLRGVGLGFWLVPEGFPWCISGIYAPREYFALFADMIGPDDARRFWVDYQDQYITREDIFYIKSLGLNSVRVPFDYRLFANEYYLGSHEPRGFELLDRVIDWCREAGIWVVLDMHCAPGSQAGWNTDGGYTYPWLFEDSGEGSRQQTIDIWTTIAKHYANDTTVIGYDLLNEPIHQFCDTARLNARLEPFYKRLVDEIRKVDQNHIVFVAGAFWNRNFDVFTEPFDDKMVYTTHLYSLSDAYCSFDYFVNFSKKHDVPIWVGEFNGRTTELLDSIYTLCEQNHFGWCLWPYKRMDNNRSLLQINEPENFELIQNYANGCYKSMEEKVVARPDIKKSKQALDQFLINCRLENCVRSKKHSKILNLNH